VLPAAAGVRDLQHRHRRPRSGRTPPAAGPVAAMVLAPRFGSLRHRGRPTLGGQLAAVAKRLGVNPHPWQRLVADVSLELVPRRDRAGLRLAAGDVGVIVARQTGKTSLVAARAILQCRLPDMAAVARRVGVDRIRPQRVAYLAQDRAAALSRWHEHVDLLMASPYAGEVARVVLQRGDEAVRFVNGSTYQVLTPSRTGARGFALDLAVIDEAMAHDVELLAAVGPTMAQRDSATGCIGAQLVVVSSAGDERSTLLAAQRELGRRAVAEGDTTRLWFEWSMPDDADPLDEAVWRATIPTLGRRDGIGLEFLRRAAETMGAEDFAREYLCRHSVRPVARALDVEAWDRLAPAGVGVSPVLAVDAAWDRSAAAIVAAGGDGDRIGVEVVEARAGTAWLAETVERIQTRWPSPVVVDRSGPAGSLVDTLERRGVNVLAVAGRQIAEAAATFADLVDSGRLGHAGDPRLSTAVSAATRRRYGEAWCFDRHTGTDTSALIAASLAAWAVATDAILIPAVW
jgi:hypothetical protein